MTVTITNKKEFLEIAADFKQFARDRKWVPRYDTEADTFSISQPHLSPDARIYYMDGEIAFYISRNGIEGVFVEYFKTTFLPRHRGAKRILSKKKKSGTTTGALIELKKDGIQDIAADFEDSIRTTLAENLHLSSRTS